MAAIRPLTLVYEEYAALSSTPTTPTLNALIAGPAYWIQDFPDDRADILLEDVYGALNAAATAASVAPVDGTDEITITDLPNNKVGAVVDGASIKAYFGNARVEVLVNATADGTVVAGTLDSFASATADFSDCLPGDILIVTHTVDAIPVTTVLTIRTVAIAGTSVTTTSELTAAVDYKFRVERNVADFQIPAAFAVNTAGTNTVKIKGGVTHAGLYVSYAQVYVAYRSLRQDLQDVLVLDNAAAVLGQLGRIDARNPLAVGANVAFSNTATSMQVFGVTSQDLAGYNAMKSSISGRKDIYAVAPLIGDLSVLAALKAEFDNLADPTVAAANGVPQKFRIVVGGGITLPPTKIVVDVSAIGQAVVHGDPLATVGTLTLPGATLMDAGVLPGDKVVLSLFTGGALAYLDLSVPGNATFNTVIETTIGGSDGNAVTFASTADGSGPGSLTHAGNAFTLHFEDNTTTVQNVEDLITALSGADKIIRVKTASTGANKLLAAGDVFTAVHLANGAGIASLNGTYHVAHVNAETIIEVTPALPAAFASGAGYGVTAVIYVGDTTVPRVVSAAYTPIVSAVLDALYLDLVDSHATFVDSGVIAGDILEMPSNPNAGVGGAAATFTTGDYESFVIASVTNQRIRIVNNGSDTALVANELPHLCTRTSPDTAIPGTATLTYRVSRVLAKAGQVTALVSTAASLASRRAVLCWPDLVDVTGLVDGSLPRAVGAPLVALPAASQPSYYLACAVAGMVANQPSQQGFTKMSAAGIKQIYHSNTYFSDTQITQISNAGWFLFQQDSTSALPYIVHQLTTDPSTLEFGELSMVKNFDFVAMFLVDILDAFVGPWNINKETIGFVQTALMAGVDSLKLDKKPRIGAPIIDAKLISLGESPVSADRLAAVIEVTFPKPLNVMELHIISS